LTAGSALLLVVAGVLAGLLATIGGLASLVSYPALLLAGLPPTAANVTNTVALVATTAGAAAGSRPELQGQGPRLRRLCAVALLGGACGAALLLTSPPGVFELVVPWLIGGASVALLLGPRLRRLAGARHADAAATAGARHMEVAAGDRHMEVAAGDRHTEVAAGDRREEGAGGAATAGVFLVAVYAGYFGAAAGVILLAILSAISQQSLARVSAAKTVIAGAANVVAATVFAVVGPVHWFAALALASGSLVGGWLGPSAVRRLPAGPLRIAIGLAGLGLAVKLAVDAGIL